MWARQERAAKIMWVDTSARTTRTNEAYQKTVQIVNEITSKKRGL